MHPFLMLNVFQNFNNQKKQPSSGWKMADCEKGWLHLKARAII
jgi:hypothetical protein